MKRRLLSWLLVIVMVCAMLPVNALASMPEAAIDQPMTETITYINPLYEDVLTEDDLVRPSDEAAVDTNAVSESEYATTFSEAGAQIRAGMTQRLETVVAYYQTENYDSGDHVDIFNAAVAHTGMPKEGDALRWVYGGYSVSISRYSMDGVYYVTYTYTMTYYTTAQQEAELDAAVENLLAELDPSGTDYEKLCTVYDYMCENIVYDDVNLNDQAYKLKYTAYAALINKTSVCQGYAALLYRLALEMGIDCRMITGTGNGGGHAWNIVRLNDVYYNADATWDASWLQGVGYYNYFLQCEDTFTEGGTDHFRDAEYDTAEFHTAYPISETDFDPAVDNVIEATSGTCGENVIWSLSADGILTISGSGDMEDYTNNWDAPWSALWEQIEQVVIEHGVTHIGDYAFMYCDSLKNLSISDSVTSIGEYPFFYCGNLSNVTIPGSVTSIDEGLFYGCSSLTHAVIPDSITSIPHRTFVECYNLTSVTLPDGITSIGHSAFSDCSGLLYVTIPDSVTFLGDWVFSNCSSLTDVTIGNGVTTISNRTFYGCSSLASVNMGSSVTTIDDGAFVSCTSLTSITIPAGVNYVGALAFSGCTALNEVYFHGGAPKIGDSAFYDVEATVYYPQNDPSWTEEIMQNYDGTITWVASCFSNHTEEIDVGLDPTCTETGLTEGSHCAACGVVLIEQEEIPAMGHSFTQYISDGNATCTEDGTMTAVCDRCESIDTVVEEGSAAGHSYNEGFCTVCGASDPNFDHTHSVVILSQPVDYVGMVGDMATFTVIAEGEDLKYQWYFSKDNGSSWEKSGGTANTLTIEFKAYRNNYLYYCVVSDSEGNTATTNTVKLTAMDVELSIIAQPENYVGAVNDSVTFALGATGNGLTYQWYFSTDDGATWSKSYSPGYATNTLAPILRAHRDGNMYKCVITDVFGRSIESNAVVMEVKSSQIVILAQPQSVENGVLGQLYQFSVIAEGENLTYRWQYSDDGGETWQVSWNQGYNSATLNVRLNANRDGNLYRCVVTSGLKEVLATESAVLNLQMPSAEILSQSGNIHVLAGETATFRVEADGMNLSYIWYRSNDKGATWSQTYLSGYNTDTLSFVVNSGRAAMYMCKVIDGSGKVVWSDPVSLTILSAELKILTQPVSVTCAAGETATFTVEAQGDTLKYQWYASSDNGATWIASYMTGYNTNEFSFVVNTVRAAKLYKCVITDAAGNTVETDAVHMRIG